MDPTPFSSADSPQPPQPDGLLEELAGLTGLLNPEQIWFEEQKLDDLETHPPAGQPDDLTPAD